MADKPAVVQAEMIHRMGHTLQELEQISGLINGFAQKMTDRAFEARAGAQEQADAIFWRSLNNKWHDRLELARSRENRDDQ